MQVILIVSLCTSRFKVYCPEYEVTEVELLDDIVAYTMGTPVSASIILPVKCCAKTLYGIISNKRIKAGFNVLFISLISLKYGLSNYQLNF